MSALVTRGLAKAYAGRVLFEDVSISVARGEAVALTGPSGTGKTTLLRCLDGLELADRGEVIVGDACIRAGDAPPARIAAMANDPIRLTASVPYGNPPPSSRCVHPDSA